MNNSRETKIKARIALCFALVLVFDFTFVLAQTSSSTATTTASAQSVTDSLNAQKAAKQKVLQDLNNQIKNYQGQIAATQAKAGSLKNEISIYDDQIASTQLQIQVKQTQIDDSNLQIEELQKLIDQKTKEIADNKKILGQLIVELNNYDDQYALKTTLGSDNLSSFLDQIHYTQIVNDKIYQLVQKIKDLKTKLESQQQELETQVKKLKELKGELQDTQDSLNTQRDLKQQLLTQTKGIEKNFQKLLTTSKTQEQDLQKEIDDLDNQIRTKLGNRTIRASKGVLAWPMDGILTQKYGNTGFTSLGYNFHNGIDIAAPAAQPIYAAADGTVLYTDQSDQTFGNWVAIKHTIPTKNGNSNIVTLYGHMRRFIVSPGQKIKQGDLVGYEGNTGNTTKKLYGPERGYHIHFGVYDAEGFGVSQGKYIGIYGPYMVPYGYSYNPLDFL